MANPLIIRNHGGAYLSVAGTKEAHRIMEARQIRCAKCGTMLWVVNELGGTQLLCPKVRTHATGWELSLKGETPAFTQRGGR